MRPEIDAKAAIALREYGITWRAIGKILAADMGRPVVFDARSVAFAVVRFKKAEAA